MLRGFSQLKETLSRADCPVESCFPWHGAADVVTLWLGAGKLVGWREISGLKICNWYRIAVGS